MTMQPQFAIPVSEDNRPYICEFLHLTPDDPDAPSIGHFILFTEISDKERKFECVNEREFVADFDIDPDRRTDKLVTDALLFNKIHKF